MISQSKQAVNTVFYVPNNEAGRELLAQMKEHLNKRHHRLWVRGRNENRKALAQHLTETKQRYANGQQPYWNGEHASLRQSVPLKHATYFAVYLISPARDRQLTRVDTAAYYREKLEEEKRTCLAWQYQSELRGEELKRLWQDLESLNKELVLVTTPSWRRVWQDVRDLLALSYRTLISRVS